MNTTTTKAEYAKRYSPPDNPPNFELTPRAVCINTEIARRGGIRSDQLNDLFPDIPTVPFGRIVRNLIKNRFAFRPKQQQELHNNVSGSLPSYIMPAPRGVQLHTAFFADPVATPKYTVDNDQMTWGYIRHQFTTTSTMLNYQTGALTVSDLAFMTEPDLWTRYASDSALNQPIFNINDYPTLMAHDFIKNPPQLQPGRSAKIPLELSAKLDWSVHTPGQSGLTTLTVPVKTRPDGYFAHQLTTPDFFFVESDEGTETILPGKSIRHSLQLFYQTSLFAKYLVYIAAFRKRSHRRQFGIPSFRVITITTNPRRVGQIIDRLYPILTCPPLNIHPDFLWFTDCETLARYSNNPYHPDHQHRNLAGDNVHLLHPAKL